MNVGVRRFVFGKLITHVKNSILKRELLTHQTINGSKYGYIPSISCSALKDEKELVKFIDISTVSPIKDTPIRSAVTDPIVIPNGGISIPINIIIRNLELPTLNKQELVDPVGNIIEKKAHKMIRIRKKKMKKHKWKKLQKKMRFAFAKVKKKRIARKENIFKEELAAILAAGDSYNPELDLNEKIKILNWEKPINHISGYFCPKWVVDEYLAKEKKKKILDERVAICLKNMK